jgi:hypothetical protein
MKDQGGPAYPQHYVEKGFRGDMETGEVYGEGGLTMRDYFAGQALAGMVSSMADDPHIPWKEGARACYMVADAMIKVRNE